MINKDLASADLFVDQIYGGSRNGNSSDDPLPKLLGVDNGAGFRHLGKRPEVQTLKLLALKTSFSDINWPDSIDRESGIFIYFGDKRKPGDLHSTPRQGNLILRNLFDEAHNFGESTHFPPIFLFGNTGTYRDVQFLGLAVPGTINKGNDEDLIAVWRTTDDGVRFQNYRATFTILDVPCISREWIKDIQAGNAVTSEYAPTQWLNWVHGRKYSPLISKPTKAIRSKSQQLPASEGIGKYLKLVHTHFHKDPYAFEKCAMEIAKLFMPNINSYDITRPWRDGGRDAIGTYQIGYGAGSVDVEFAMEAKCYSTTTGVGVRALSRLIARLRHRQFGILVTTSYLDSQAYQELIQDGHPVVIISGNDIATKLMEVFGTLGKVKIWLNRL